MENNVKSNAESDNVVESTAAESEGVKSKTRNKVPMEVRRLASHNREGNTGIGEFSQNLRSRHPNTNLRSTRSKNK